MKKFLYNSRPRFWIYTAGPFWISAAILYPLGQDVIPMIIMLVYFTFPANILIYGINDIYDKVTDIFNPKKGDYEELLNVYDTKKIWILISILNIPFWIYAYMFLPQAANLSLVLFVVLAWQYSAPPLRAKAVPFLDSLVSGMLYIVPACVSWGIVTESFPPIMPLIAGFLWAYAMHVYSAIPDISADTKANIQTSATYLGKNKTIFVCLILYIISAIIAYSSLGFFAPLLCAVYVYLMWISYTKNTPEEVLSVYKYFPVVNTIIGSILFIISFLISQGVLSL